MTCCGVPMIVADRPHHGQLGQSRQTPIHGRCPCKGLTWYPGLRTIRMSEEYLTNRNTS